MKTSHEWHVNLACSMIWSWKSFLYLSEQLSHFFAVVISYLWHTLSKLGAQLVIYTCRKEIFLNSLSSLFFPLFCPILTGSMLVSPWRNEKSIGLVHTLFCSSVARPVNAAETEAAASIDGGYIKNFSSAIQKRKKGKTNRWNVQALFFTIRRRNQRSNDAVLLKKNFIKLNFILKGKRASMSANFDVGKLCRFFPRIKSLSLHG